MLAPERQYYFTVEEFMRLDVPDNTELLGGVVYIVSPVNRPHTHAVWVLTNELAGRLYGTTLSVLSQGPVVIPDYKGKDAPLPDIAVLRRGPILQHSTSASGDIAALVEVSDTTYRVDRGYKMPLYVRAGVPSFIVDIGRRRVESYASEDDLAKPHGVVFVEGQSVAIAGVDIAVSSLFVDDAADAGNEVAGRPV